MQVTSNGSKLKIHLSMPIPISKVGVYFFNVQTIVDIRLTANCTINSRIEYEPASINDYYADIICSRCYLSNYNGLGYSSLLKLWVNCYGILVADTSNIVVQAGTDIIVNAATSNNTLNLASSNENKMSPYSTELIKIPFDVNRLT